MRIGITAIGSFVIAFAMAGCGGGTASTTKPAVHDAWTWIGGANTPDQKGIYGTVGVTDPVVVPGARAFAAHWIDADGNLWLFGGIGFDSTGNMDWLNDMWKYSNGKWAWMGGSNLIRQAGIYGTKGTPTSTNFPGARLYAVSWTDPSGNFWLFGGNGIDSAGNAGQLNDLWEYTNNQWTWVSGSNVCSQFGVAGAWQGAGIYGTKGVADPTNVPGARFAASGWSDSSGNLWLFGGEGSDSRGYLGPLNDLWRFSKGMWTWMAGSNLDNQFGTYGTQGTGAPGNTPGARTGASPWTDAEGNLWLFGGLGNDKDGVRCEQTLVCQLSDLWRFSNGQWTWIGGPNQVNEPGTYGTQGVPSTSSWPGPRNNAVSWTDSAGNLWLLGGNWANDYNDLWRYSGGEWTWMSGSNQPCQAGVYGTQGIASSSNTPGARDGSASWTDKSGNLWLFGAEPFCSGSGFGSALKYNDLWEYQP